MTEKQWGECMNCQWWQIEPEAAIEKQTMGSCIDKDLQSYQLLVSGESGCNRFIVGTPAHAKGSSSRPPATKPTR